MNHPTSQTIGLYQKYSRVEHGVIVHASAGLLRILFYNEGVVKISALKSGDFDDFSYAVAQQPASTVFEILDRPQALILKSASVQVVITKGAVRVRFETLSGEVINEDDPGLGTEWIGEQVTTYKKLIEGERFIGLGEKTGGLDRRGSHYINWTTDAYGYHGGQDPLYVSTPFYIGIHKHLYGIFFDNSYKSFFNFGASNNRFSSFGADCGDMNYYFFAGKTVPEIVGAYTWLTGRMEMPPLWSLGYQQCRYSYYPDKEVKNLARTFREKDIPADTIVLDIHYMDQYKIFTWDKKNFPDPSALLKELEAAGFHVVVMCDPGIKVEDGYKPYEDGKTNEVFLKYPDGQNYSGQVWPGWCHFPDFTKPATREWWKNQLRAYSDLGIEGYWNDMNEIATWGHGLPENIQFDFEGQKGTTRRGRNLFGFQMARSTYEGTKALMKGKRPFNLTRSGFSGVQRYAAVWTGDNVSYDEHMLLGVRLVNSLGLTGVAFAGYDAGGFVGEANTKLFSRWISIAALSPFFRGHTMINTRDAEPWSFGEEAEQLARNYIKLRYQLMPYIYSLFHEAVETGMPVQRTLALQWPHEARVYDGAFYNQYLFGPSILVCPAESTRDILKIFLPEGDWYSLYTGAKYQGNQEIFLECPVHRLPVFVKGGSVLPMKKVGINTSSAQDELILHLYAGAPSTFELYQDDGATFEYQRGQSSTRSIEYRNGELKVGATKGSYASRYKQLTIVLHGFVQAARIESGSESKSVSRIEHSFFTPMEKYDPINDPEWMGSEPVATATFSYEAGEMVFKIR